MMIPHVKICGITRPEDALLAVELGATWVGFLFWPESPRWIPPSAAAKILERLPPHAIGVGVFVNQAREEIATVADQVGLGAVQLHGDEDPTLCAGLGRRVIKAVGLSGQSTERAADSVWSEATVLLDADDRKRRGGTGHRVNWTVAATIARRRRTILSGGLTSENVGTALCQVSPYGIDVSSGVEAEPGIKDPERLRCFFDAVRLASNKSGVAEGLHRRTWMEGSHDRG